MSLLKWIGVSPTSTKLSTGTEGILDGEDRYFGLENFGNTCYCNSVLQALYFCKPFRDCVHNFPIRSPLIVRMEQALNESLQPPTIDPKMKRKSSTNLTRSSSTLNLGMNSKLNFNFDDYTTHSELGIDSNLFTSLKDLFAKIECQSKRLGTLAPSSFISQLKLENELFRGAQHQDAHEFLNFTLNKIAEHVVTMRKNEVKPSEDNQSNEGGAESNKSDGSSDVSDSWVQHIFEGKLTNETRCLTCDTVTSKEESFLDLSIDIEENSSVSSCLRQFSANEMLCDRNKYFCDVCNGLQEAEKRMKIKKVPNVLALHLKRFKYQEQLQRYAKLSYRVVFPMDLRLFNTTNDSEDTDRLYTLFGIVVHIGSGLNHGHYISVVKSGNNWILFDDDTVERIDEEDLSKFFGDLPNVGSGYVLFYEANDMSLEPLGLPSKPNIEPEVLSQNTGTRKPSTLNPPTYTLSPNPNPNSPTHSPSPSPTPTTLNPATSWFGKSSKVLRSKPSELKIPKHEFFSNSEKEKDRELATKTPSAVMTAWR